MKPFLNGRKPHEEAPLRSLPGHSHKAPPASGLVRPVPTGPTVDVVKQGDKVARIIVTCACGERIEVECLYPAGHA